MIVPLDLYVLVQKLGRCTPSLVLGWRVGHYLQEMFEGLAELRLAVCARGDFLEGLRLTRTENAFPLDLVETGGNEGWHACAWHPGTGTLMEFTFSAEHVAMDSKGAGSRQDAERQNFYGLAAYGSALDRQIARLMEEPLESLCKIRERMVMKSRAAAGASPVRCRRCGKLTSIENLWHADGIPACSSCAGVHPKWIELN